VKKSFLIALIKVLALCIIVFSVSAYFVYDAKIIGWVVFGSGLLCLVALRLSKILVSHVWPDIVFGLID